MASRDKEERKEEKKNQYNISLTRTSRCFSTVLRIKVQEEKPNKGEHLIICSGAVFDLYRITAFFNPYYLSGLMYSMRIYFNKISFDHTGWNHSN